MPYATLRSFLLSSTFTSRSSLVRCFCCSTFHLTIWLLQTVLRGGCPLPADKSSESITFHTNVLCGNPIPNMKFQPMGSLTFSFWSVRKLLLSGLIPDGIWLLTHK
jgi:hypothetical protein